MLEKCVFSSFNWCQQNCAAVFTRLIVVPQVGHDVDHFTSPEGVPGVPETNFNNRPNSFKVLSPPRTCVVMFTYELLLNWIDELKLSVTVQNQQLTKQFAARLTTVWMKKLKGLSGKRWQLALRKSSRSMLPLVQKRTKKQQTGW